MFAQDARMSSAGGRGPRAVPKLSSVERRFTKTVRDVIGADAFEHDGRLKDWRLGMLPGTDEALLEQVPRLINTSRLRYPDSGSAMVFYSFLPWYSRKHELPLAGRRGFEELRFDARCPTGLRGTPPHLDLVASAGPDVVAVTARGARSRSGKSRGFAAGYCELASANGLGPWEDLARRTYEDDSTYQAADAASLIKFVFGLARTFPKRSIKLVVLYWRPPRHFNHATVKEHEEALNGIADEVQSSTVALLPLSFGTLWSQWLDECNEVWLRDAVTQLRHRYEAGFGGPGRS